VWFLHQCAGEFAGIWNGCRAATREIDIKIVGIVVPNSAVVQDDAERSVSALVILTPALTARVAQCCGTALRNSGFGSTGQQRSQHRRDGGRAAPSRWRRPSTSASPPSARRRRSEPSSPSPSPWAYSGELPCSPPCSSLASVIGRQLRLGVSELSILRGSWCDPVRTSSDGLAASWARILDRSWPPPWPWASLRSVPLARYAGVSRQGIAFDWTVLGLGTLGLVLVLSAVAGFFAYQQAPHRTSRQHERVKGVRALIAQVPPLGCPSQRSQESGSPLSLGGSGIRRPCVQPSWGGSGRQRHHQRPDFRRQPEHPGLASESLRVELELRTGHARRRRLHPRAQRQRNSSSMILMSAAWTGVLTSLIASRRPEIPIIGGTPNAPVGPPILSGHTLEAPNQIVLGATTLAELHKRVV